MSYIKNYYEQKEQEAMEADFLEEASFEQRDYDDDFDVTPYREEYTVVEEINLVEDVFGGDVEAMEDYFEDMNE